MKPESKGPQAILNLPAPTKELITFAKKISAAMNGNPYFPSPVPPLPKLDAAIAALDASETAVGGGVAKTKQRNADRLAVVRHLTYELHYVQSIADQQSTVADAEAVITSAGMFVKKIGKHNKAELSARPGPVSGSVQLVALAQAPSAAYAWQFSAGQGAWTSAPETMKAKTTITGLAPVAIYTFRVRALTRAGLTEWSQPVSLLVP
ncbi:MAG: fibronectin type III domain-containing protein [Byssovorax sp.]